MLDGEGKDVTLQTWEVPTENRWRWQADVRFLGHRAHFSSWAASMEDAIKLGDAWVKTAVGLILERQERKLVAAAQGQAIDSLRQIAAN